MYFRSSMRAFSSAASRSMLVAEGGVLAFLDSFQQLASQDIPMLLVGTSVVRKTDKAAVTTAMTSKTLSTILRVTLTAILATMQFSM